MSPHSTPGGHQCLGPWPGPVCVTCASPAPPVHGLVLVHGPGNVELLKCHVCGSTRDAYSERGPHLILLDLLLLHPPAFRHCLFNRFPLHNPARSCPKPCPSEAAKAAELAPASHPSLLAFLSCASLTLLLTQGCLGGALRGSGQEKGTGGPGPTNGPTSDGPTGTTRGPSGLGLELSAGHLPGWLLTSLLSYCCTLALCFLLLLLFLRLSLGHALRGPPQPRHSHDPDSSKSNHGPDSCQTSHSDPQSAMLPDQSLPSQPPRPCSRSPPDTAALAAVAALALVLAECPKLLALGMLVWSYPPHLATTLCGLCAASSLVSFSVLLSPLTGQEVWVASGLCLFKLCGELWSAGALDQNFGLPVHQY